AGAAGGRTASSSTASSSTSRRAPARAAAPHLAPAWSAGWRHGRHASVRPWLTTRVAARPDRASPPPPHTGTRLRRYSRGRRIRGFGALLARRRPHPRGGHLGRPIRADP